MANNTQKVVIITTKRYPITNDWEEGKNMDVNRLGLFTKDDDTDIGIEGLVARLEFQSTDLKGKFKEKPCLRTKRFNADTWVAYVVPCMQNKDSVTKELKGQYLEYILELCSEGVDAQNVYLVAHEKDFVNFGGVTGELVKEKHIPTPNCERLKELVKRGHAYMFQHDDGNPVGKDVIPKIDNGFDKEDFERLLGIIDAEMEMNNFFTMVDKDTSNEYKQTKTTTIAP